jgi:hypothetical protein
VQIPTVISVTATNIDKTLATFVGSISDTGNDSCSVRGFDWGTDVGYGNSLIESSTYGLGQFSLLNSSLHPAVPYYFRAKAINAAGTGYGDALSFVTIGNDEEDQSASKLLFDALLSYWTGE